MLFLYRSWSIAVSSTTTSSGSGASGSGGSLSGSNSRVRPLWMAGVGDGGLYAVVVLVLAGNYAVEAVANVKRGDRRRAPPPPPPPHSKGRAWGPDQLTLSYWQRRRCRGGVASAPASSSSSPKDQYNVGAHAGNISLRTALTMMCAQKKK